MKNLTLLLGKIPNYLYIIVLSFIGFFAFAFLYFMQSIGKYPSDLIAHITSALSPTGNDYTIIKSIFRLLYKLTNNTYGISIFLSIVTILIFLSTYFILRKLLPSENLWKLRFFSIILNIIIAIYVPVFNKHMNAGLQEATEWHNSTYLCMKLIGLITIIVYLNISKTYLEKIPVKQCTSFVLLLILVNSIKPNFVLSFAPAMLVMLIIDLVKTKGQKLRNIIIFGLMVIPSLLVLLFQAKVLYVNDTESGIILSFAYTLRHYADYPLLSILQSIAFPLWVFVMNIKELLKDKTYSFLNLVWFFSFLEYIFLQEIGSRINDGNFDWGNSFGVFLLFIAAIYMLQSNRLDINFNKLHSKKTRDFYFYGAYILLSLHFISGIIYFIRLITGYSYL